MTTTYDTKICVFLADHNCSTLFARGKTLLSLRVQCKAGEEKHDRGFFPLRNIFLFAVAFLRK